MRMFAGKTAVVTGASSGDRAGGCAAPGRGRGARVRGRAPGGGARESGRGDSRAGGAATAWWPTCGILVDPAMTGAGRLDAMVTNAGVPFRGPLANGDPEAWRERTPPPSY
jgi:hypothetical protein